MREKRSQPRKEREVLKMKVLQVPGSVITEKTARGYLLRLAAMLYENLDQASASVLYDIESRIVNAGLLDWEEVEKIELEAIAG